MLAELRVSNLALIDDLKLTLGAGLNVLSGETGAGKSIVIGAINLLLGDRAAVEQIREGEETALVEGIFNSGAALFPEVRALLEEAGIEAGEELIVAREVSRGGRSVGRVQGRAVPISFLKELGQLLVDLHGQHQHQSLLRTEYHLELLDSFGGEKTAACRRLVAGLFKRRQELRQELSALGQDSAARERRMDILAFQLKEIQAARLSAGEEEELLKQERILAHAEKLGLIVTRAYSEIYAGDESSAAAALVDRVNSSRGALVEAAQIDESLAHLVEMLENAAAQLEEVSLELRDYRSRIEFNPAELAATQERLNQIRTLKRKYGDTVEQVLAFADHAALELERLQNSEALAGQITQQIAVLEDQLNAASLELRGCREEAAAGLERLLEDSLHELALPNARIKIAFTARDAYTVKGMDQVEFLFSANPGETVKPLARIISGGEMSRVMLALKTILARQDRIPTLIFDEVDAGIGGATVQAVAEKLSLLAGHHQVICVTHSPQIAAMADRHFQLYKELAGERALTRAVQLEEKQRREELARMLDGASIDQVSLQHVDSLLDRARRFKQEAGT
jgi:DNA repair protein RecN (Recombination protein N)